MVKDLNDNNVVATDALNNMSDLENNNQILCCHRECLTIYSDKNKNGTVKKWIDIDMISKLQKCENCSSLNGLSIDKVEKGEHFTTYDKTNIPRNGYKIIESIEGLGEQKVETSNEHNDSNDFARTDDLIFKSTDSCSDGKSVELNQIVGKPVELNQIVEKRTDIDNSESSTETDTNTEITKETSKHTWKQTADLKCIKEDVVENETDVNDSSYCEVRDSRDSSGYVSDVSKLDINNPNLFSDFEDSDDDVFETKIKRSTTLPRYINFVANKSKKPSQTHSESAILTDLSERTEKPIQTVSDSAIVTALSKRTRKSIDSTARRKSVHFAIFPYIIEIPRVSDLEEEFYEAERERYGKVPCSV